MYAPVLYQDLYRSTGSLGYCNTFSNSVLISLANDYGTSCVVLTNDSVIYIILLINVPRADRNRTRDIQISGVGSTTRSTR